MNRTLINTALTLTLTGILLVAGAPGSSAEEIREADKMVHKALKDRTGTFCKQVLPAWFSVKGEKNVGGFRTLVADCYRKRKVCSRPASFNRRSLYKGATVATAFTPQRPQGQGCAGLQ